MYFFAMPCFLLLDLSDVVVVVAAAVVVVAAAAAVAGTAGEARKSFR